MDIDVRYVCDDGECVWLEGKKYRCLKNAKATRGVSKAVV